MRLPATLFGRLGVALLLIVLLPSAVLIAPFVAMGELGRWLQRRPGGGAGFTDPAPLLPSL